MELNQENEHLREKLIDFGEDTVEQAHRKNIGEDLTDVTEIMTHDNEEHMRKNRAQAKSLKPTKGTQGILPQLFTNKSGRKH